MVDLYRGKLAYPGTGNTSVSALKNFSTKVLRIYRIAVASGPAGPAGQLRMGVLTGLVSPTSTTFASATPKALSRNAAALPATIYMQTGDTATLANIKFFSAYLQAQSSSGTNGTTFVDNNRPFSTYWDVGNSSAPIQRLTIRNSEGLFFTGPAGSTSSFIDITFSCEDT